MEKPFLEVFPGLHIGEELKELLKLVMVEKVSMPKDRSSLRIYIVSPRLIHKKNIYSMEEGIAKPPFGPVYAGKAVPGLQGQHPDGV